MQQIFYRWNLSDLSLSAVLTVDTKQEKLLHVHVLQADNGLLSKYWTTIYAYSSLLYHSICKLFINADDIGEIL